MKGSADSNTVDVLLRIPRYDIQKTPLKSSLYSSNVEVKTPTLNSMLGDKLTTLGPNTIGIKRNKDPLLVGKHLYDVSNLFRYVDSLEKAYNAYVECFKLQREFRRLNIPLERAIEDLRYVGELLTIGNWDVRDRRKAAKKDFEFIKSGVRKLRPFLIKRRFTTLTARETGGQIGFISKVFELFEEKQISDKKNYSCIFELPRRNAE